MEESFNRLHQCLNKDIIGSVFVDGAYMINDHMWTGRGGVEMFRKVLLDGTDYIKVDLNIDQELKNRRYLKCQKLIKGIV